LPSARETVTCPRGAWIRIEYTAEAAHRKVQGELIAVDPTAVHVLDPAGELIAVPTAWVTGGRAAVHTNVAGALALWGVLGTASTVSHGLLLIWTAPLLWLHVAIVLPVQESRAGLLEIPPHDWGLLRPWARFPQGLPEGLTRADLGTPYGGQGDDR
jgi:hypothetical protein